MKVTVAFNLGAHLLDKIDDLKIKRGTNRSEAIRHIISEFFRPGSMNLADLIDEFERLKGQNRDLKYQLEKMMSTIAEHNNQILSMLLILGGRDEVFRREVMKRYPQFWEKKSS
jgi:metal-responsive CopG/Arc/MetJ family transcriptional regulator